MKLIHAPQTSGGLASSIIGYLVRHRTAVNLLLTLIVVAGIAAGLRIKVEQLPDVSVETAEVTIAWPGVNPAKVDKAIVSRVEPKLLAVKGVKTATAVAREGVASFSLEFEPRTDMASAIDAVKSAVAQVRDLPDGVGEPVVRRDGYSQGVADVVISGRAGTDLLERYAEELRTRLNQRGVTNTSLDGISDPEIRVDVRPQAVERYGLSLHAVAEAIRLETGVQNVGEINDGAARIRTAGRPLTAGAISSAAVRTLPNGAKLRVSDIASVTEETLDREVAVYHQGQPAVILKVSRDASGDPIRMQHQVEAAVAELTPTLPPGISVFLAHAQAGEIAGGLMPLVTNGLAGFAIVFALLFLFLNARSALWIAAAVPVAFAATLALMYTAGVSINMISLFALIIALGAVVGQAIILGERADRLARQGMNAAEAAPRAVERLSAPVISAALTAIIAFASLWAIGDGWGHMLSDMPLTVTAAVVASLVVSFLIVPARMRRALRSTGPSAIDLPSEYVNRVFSWFAERLFRPLMRMAVKLKYPVVAAAALLLAVSVSPLLDGSIAWRFFSAPDQSAIHANVAMREGATRAHTKAAVTELERALDTVSDRYLKAFGAYPVKRALAKNGGPVARGLMGSDTKDPVQLAGYDVELIASNERTYSAAKFAADWEAEVRPKAMLETLAIRAENLGPAEPGVGIRLTGSDETALKAAADALKSRLAKYPNVRSLEDDLAYDKPEFAVALTPKGEALGFTMENVARVLRDRLDGVEAVTLSNGSREIVARVQLETGETAPAFLTQSTLTIPGGGGLVSLNEIATISEARGFSSIRRENGERRVVVTGELAGDAGAAKAVIAALRHEVLPGLSSQFGVDWSLEGAPAEEHTFIYGAVMALTVALVGIYGVLAWVLGSWTRPLLVMSMIPLGLVGATWGHWVNGMPMGMFSVVAAIGMSGLIINAAVLLVTAVDERARRQDMIGAIIDGACERLRAIFLLTIATVGGLAPLLLDTSSEVLFLKPAVITLAYGLGIGMPLVLMVVPAALAIRHAVAMSLKSLRRYGEVRRRLRAAGSAGAAKPGERPEAVDAPAPLRPIEGGPVFPGRPALAA